MLDPGARSAHGALASTFWPSRRSRTLIAKIGDIWKSWGWQVIERDRLTKPNRFGSAPDGYILEIEARPDPKYPPSLIGSSPCFPGNLRRDDVPRPPIIGQGRQDSCRRQSTSINATTKSRFSQALGRLPVLASLGGVRRQVGIHALVR